MDIRCAKCGEPWDSYGVRHGDMTLTESGRFLNGEGCPHCGFGTKCTNCSGTGYEKVERSQCQCFGEHFRFVRVTQHNRSCWQMRPMGDLRSIKVGETISEEYHVEDGYLPSVRMWTPSLIANGIVLEQGELKECRDGWYISVKVRCPDCETTEADKCPVCNGTGKFTTTRDDKGDLFKVAGDLLAGDEDGRLAMLEDFS